MSYIIASVVASYVSDRTITTQRLTCPVEGNIKYFNKIANKNMYKVSFIFLSIKHFHSVYSPTKT